MRIPLLKRLGLIFKRNISVSDLDRLLDFQLSGKPTKSGVRITNDTAMNYSAVFNAVQIIAGTVASLPLILYQRIGERKRKRATDHFLVDVLHNQPNPEMVSYTWRETMQAHMLLWGNGYSQIIKDTSGRVTALWPLSPAAIEVKRINGKIVYVFKQSGKNDVIFSSEQILHIPGLGFDGRVGYSVLTIARESMGLGLAMEQFNSQFYGQGTHIGGVAEHPASLGPVAHENLKKSLNEKFAGLGNSHKLIVLEEGMKYTPTAMPLQDAQFLESRVFQVSEIARWFNLPPHKLKELSKATFSNIEQQQIEFVQDTIRPWLVRWEQHLGWKLLSQDERKQFFAEFLIDGLLRGDMKSRNEALSIQRMNGIINADEWRAIENQNPIGGKAGKIYWMPLNMTDANEEEKEEPSNDNFQQEEEENSNVNYELRAIRSIRERARYKKAFKPIFRLATNKILEFEVPGIQKISRKAFNDGSGLGEFKFKTDEFYKKNKSKIRKIFAAVFEEYLSTIYFIAADEVGLRKSHLREEENKEKLPEQYQEYIDKFVDHTTDRYIESSRGQVNQVASKHRENDAVGAIDKRLKEWEEKRPDKVANREVVDGEAGGATETYFEAGFQSAWVTVGNSCPYCDDLNGKIVSRGQSFIASGESFEPLGATNGPLVPTANIGHPAAHGGCDCTVRATTHTEKIVKEIEEEANV